MKKMFSTLLTGLFLTHNAMPAYAFLGFDLGGDDKQSEKENPTPGAAGPEGSKDESTKLEKCDKPFGTLAVAEPQDFVNQGLRAVGLPSPNGLIRMLIQQSGCFVVVERGVAFKNIMQERDLAAGGNLRTGSNMGGGQLVTADYVMTPDVVFSQKDAGGVGGALGGLGLFGAAAGLLAAGLKFKEAQTSMTLADARSGLQISAAQGMAKKADFAIGGLFVGAGAVGALGAYENTAEGKVVAAGFLDNWNNIVRSIRNSPQLARQNINLKEESGKVVQANAGAHSGDVVVAKIGGVKLYTEPNKTSKVVATLKKGEEAVFNGEEKNGFYSVESGEGAGWVDSKLVKRN